MVGDPAVEGERDPARMAAGELDREPAELGGERDVRAEHLEILGADDRDVDGVRDEAAVERGDDLLGDDQAGAVLGLVGGRGEMRRRRRRSPDRAAHLVRLGEKTSSAAPATLPERIAAASAASSTSSPRAALTMRTPSRIFSIASVPTKPRVSSVSGRVERDEVGGLEDGLRRLRVVDAELAEAIGRDERVVADHVHAEPERATGDLAADPAEAEHAERLVGKLDPAPARALPAAFLQRRVSLRDVPGERHQQADRVLGGGDDGRVGSVRDDDAPAGRRPTSTLSIPTPARPITFSRSARSITSAVSFVAERMTIAS